MHGLLVVNHFLRSAKFAEIYDWLLAAAAKQGVELHIKTNAEIISMLAKPPRTFLDATHKPDFILFWDKDIRLAYLLESYGLRLFNRASAIETCDDKARTYTALRGLDLPMPKTTLLPMSYAPVDYSANTYIDELAANLKFPQVVKECFGSFGDQVYLAHNLAELKTTLAKIGNRPTLLQDFVASSAGVDLRLNVVGGTVVAAMKRVSSNGDFRANVTGGARMQVHDASTAEVALAVAACRALALDFGGVDLLFAEDGSPILCEINSNAHFKNIHDCTGINVADAIIEYIMSGA